MSSIGMWMEEATRLAQVVRVAGPEPKVLKHLGKTAMIGNTDNAVAADVRKYVANRVALDDGAVLAEVVANGRWVLLADRPDVDLIETRLDLRVAALAAVRVVPGEDQPDPSAYDVAANLSPHDRKLVWRAVSRGERVTDD